MYIPYIYIYLYIYISTGFAGGPPGLPDPPEGPLRAQWSPMGPIGPPYKDFYMGPHWGHGDPSGKTGGYDIFRLRKPSRCGCCCQAGRPANTTPSSAEPRWLSRAPPSPSPDPSSSSSSSSSSSRSLSSSRRMKKSCQIVER